ncbi:hypothetical protein BC828DRAFT_396551 [Blastocladiella britannica]|nr:hypothetical protein BC828DRAFT_396551 [Blastocladiella britannica]
MTSSSTTTPVTTVGEPERLLFVQSARVSVLTAEPDATQPPRAAGLLEVYSVELATPASVEGAPPTHISLAMLTVPGIGDLDAFQLPLTADTTVELSEEDPSGFTVTAPDTGVRYALTIHSKDQYELQALVDLLSLYTTLKVPSQTYRNTLALVGPDGQVVGTLADSINLDTSSVNPGSRGPVMITSASLSSVATPVAASADDKKAPIQWTVTEAPSVSARGVPSSAESRMLASSELVGDWLVTGAGYLAQGITRASISARSSGWVTPNATPLVITPHRKGNVETAKKVSAAAVQGASSSPISWLVASSSAAPVPLPLFAVPRARFAAAAAAAAPANGDDKETAVIRAPVDLGTVVLSSRAHGGTLVTTRPAASRAIQSEFLLFLALAAQQAAAYGAILKSLASQHASWHWTAGPGHLRVKLDVTRSDAAALALLTVGIIVWFQLVTGAVVAGAVSVATTVGSAVAARVAGPGGMASLPADSKRARTLHLTSAALQSLAVLADKASVGGRMLVQATGRGVGDLIEYKYGGEAGEVARGVTEVSENLWIVYFDKAGFRRMVLLAGAGAAVHEASGHRTAAPTGIAHGSASCPSPSAKRTAATQDAVPGLKLPTTLTAADATALAASAVAAFQTHGPKVVAAVQERAPAVAAAVQAHAPAVAAAVRDNAPKVAAAVAEHGPRVAAAVASGAWALWSKVSESMQAAQEHQAAAAAAAGADVTGAPAAAAAAAPSTVPLAAEGKQ